MELEVREVSGEEKSKLGHRLKAYNNEMQRFEQDLVSEDVNYNIWDYIEEKMKRWFRLMSSGWNAATFLYLLGCIWEDSN